MYTFNAIKKKCLEFFIFQHCRLEQKDASWCAPTASLQVALLYFTWSYLPTLYTASPHRYWRRFAVLPSLKKKKKKKAHTSNW